MAGVPDSIEDLFHKVVYRSCEVSKRKLTLLHKEITQNVDLLLTEQYWKVVILMAFIQGNHQKVISLISSRTFAEENFKFLRKIYKESQRIVNPQINRMAPINYPASIDPKNSNGITESLDEYLSEMCVLERKGKVTISVKQIVDESGVAGSLVAMRIQFHRDLLNSAKGKRAESKKKEPLKSCNALFPDMFPLYRVPLSEPLTIQIP